MHTMMTIKMPKLPKVIYESPDKGNTVYARTTGSNERTLVNVERMPNWRARWHKWEEIMKVAETNTALNDLVKQAEMVYVLTKNN
jgi:hypothetical protein